DHLAMRQARRELIALQRLLQLVQLDVSHAEPGIRRGFLWKLGRGDLKLLDRLVPALIPAIGMAHAQGPVVTSAISCHLIPLSSLGDSGGRASSLARVAF